MITTVGRSWHNFPRISFSCQDWSGVRATPLISIISYSHISFTFDILWGWELSESPADCSGGAIKRFGSPSLLYDERKFTLFYPMKTDEREIMERWYRTNEWDEDTVFPCNVESLSVSYVSISTRNTWSNQGHFLRCMFSHNGNVNHHCSWAMLFEADFAIRKGITFLIHRCSNVQISRTPSVKPMMLMERQSERLLREFRMSPLSLLSRFLKPILSRYIHYHPSSKRREFEAHITPSVIVCLYCVNGRVRRPFLLEKRAKMGRLSNPTPIGCLTLFEWEEGESEGEIRF